MKFVKTLLAILGLLAGFIMIAPAPAQAASFCGITWGSLAKVAGTGSTASITNVRAGQHACFDRIVVDVQGRATGYDVRYVSAVANPGSGATVPMRGVRSCSCRCWRQPIIPRVYPPTCRPIGVKS